MVGYGDKNLELWKQYLPKGSSVDFDPHLTGSPIVSAVLAGKMHIGTMGDMPALIAVSRKEHGDVRLASVPIRLSMWPG